MIWRHVGKGTFVAGAAPKARTRAMVELGRQLTPFRMMRARLAIEPAIAREAAVNASGETLRRMQRAIDRAKAATTWKEYEAQDDLFHRSIAEASDNLLLLTLFDQLNEVRRAVAWGSVIRETRAPLARPFQFPRTRCDRRRHIAAAIRRRRTRRCASISAPWRRRLFGEV